MNAHAYTDYISIESKEEYREYQDMLCKAVSLGLSEQKDVVTLKWKKKTVIIELNHSSFLVGYNYGVSTTLRDIEQQNKPKKE